MSRLFGSAPPMPITGPAARTTGGRSKLSTGTGGALGFGLDSGPVNADCPILLPVAEAPSFRGIRIPLATSGGSDTPRTSTACGPTCWGARHKGDSPRAIRLGRRLLKPADVVGDLLEDEVGQVVAAARLRVRQAWQPGLSPWFSERGLNSVHPPRQQAYRKTATATSLARAGSPMVVCLDGCMSAVPSVERGEWSVAASAAWQGDCPPRCWLDTRGTPSIIGQCRVKR